MAPTIALGTNNAGTTVGVTYALPSHQTDDVLLLTTECNVTAGLTAPSGWSNVVNSPKAQGSNVTTLNGFWKRATSGSETNPVVAATIDHQIGSPLRIRGGLISGNPWDASTSGGQTSSASGRTFSGFNTLTADSLIVYLLAADADTAIDIFGTLATPTGLTGFTTLTTNPSTNGNGGELLIAYGTKATAGFVGNLTWTFSTAAAWSGIALAFPPAGAGSIEFEGWGISI